MTDVGRITTRRDVLRNVSARWSMQYDRGHYAVDMQKQKISSALKAIDGDTASVEDINAIIGNDSWTNHCCDGCGQNHEILLQIGDTPDYEARWVDLCADCLRKGVAQIEAAVKSNQREIT